MPENLIHEVVDNSSDGSGGISTHQPFDGSDSHGAGSETRSIIDNSRDNERNETANSVRIDSAGQSLHEQLPRAEESLIPAWLADGNVDRIPVAEHSNRSIIATYILGKIFKCDKLFKIFKATLSRVLLYWLIYGCILAAISTSDSEIKRYILLTSSLCGTLKFRPKQIWPYLVFMITTEILVVLIKDVFRVLLTSEILPKLFEHSVESYQETMVNYYGLTIKYALATALNCQYQLPHVIVFLVSKKLISKLLRSQFIVDYSRYYFAFGVVALIIYWIVTYANIITTYNTESFISYYKHHFALWDYIWKSTPVVTLYFCLSVLLPIVVSYYVMYMYNYSISEERVRDYLMAIY